MTNGRKRFEHYLQQLEILINKASTESNPAEWLYENNARTTLFMLEALSKLYKNLHNEKIFDKLLDKFKQLEDMIGDIDHYDNYIKQFTTNKEIPPLLISRIQEKKQESDRKLNQVLIEDEWTGGNSIINIRKKLDEVEWMNESDEINAIRDFYEKEIDKVNDFYKSTDTPFTMLEDQVHEIRRKLRWLSIYPHALQGCIQLTETNITEDFIKKYLTPEIVNSPYNKLPEPDGNEYILLLVKSYFFALSWIILELGKLKDKGLTIDILHETRSNVPEIQESMEDLRQAAVPDTTIESVLTESSQICSIFFKEKIIDKLIHSIERKNN